MSKPKLEWRASSDGDRYFTNVMDGQLIVSENKYSNWQIDCFVLPIHMRNSWFFKHAIGCQFGSAKAASECLEQWYFETPKAKD